MTTEAEVQTARERHTVAAAQLESSRRALQLVQSGATEQRRQAEADVERAAASLRSAQVERAFAFRRRAPFACNPSQHCGSEPLTPGIA